MASGRRVTIEFLGDSRDLQRAVGDAESSTSRMGETLKKIGRVAAVGLAVAAGAAVKFGIDAVGAASDLNETVNKSQVVFGKHAKDMEDWAGRAATSLGLSKNAALGAASQFGDLFSQLGSTKKEAAQTAVNVVSLATDLGSFHNLETAEVLDQISGAMRGEYDSIQRIIPGLSDARVKEEALRASGKKSVDALTEREKAMAALTIIQKDSVNATNDFTETSGSLANQQKILRAQLENVSASLGQKLLPVAVKLATFANDTLIPALKRFGAYLAEVLPPIFERIRAVVNKVLGMIRGDVSGNMGAIRETFANVVSIIRILWAKFGKILVDNARSTFKNIRTVIGGALKIVQGIVKVFSSALKGDWKGVWKGIQLILKGAWQVIKGIVGQGLNLVKTAVRSAMVIVKGIFGAAWDGIKTVVANGVGKVVDAIRAVPGKIRALGGLFRSAGGAVIDALLNGLRGGVGFVSDIAGNVWDAVRGMLNAAIDKINAALEFNIPIPMAPDVNVNPPNIPHLAKGGLVTRPTLALIGEDGPEAVVPLGSKNRPRGMMPGMGGGNVYVQVVSWDPAAAGKAVVDALRKQERLTGKVFLASPA